MTLHDLILEAILDLPQMKGETLIHLSIVGSRSKQLDSHDSDYDLKAVILRPKEDYLLQKVVERKSFSVTLIDPDDGKNIEVEGTLVDYLTMQSYVLKSGQAAYDALFGIPIYTTRESEYLKELFQRSYNARELLRSYQGLLGAEQKRAEKKGRITGYIKHAANMVYYASAVHAFQSPEPPLPDAFFLLDTLDDIDPELREQMKGLYEKRKVDKSRSDYNMAPFIDFIDKARRLKAPDSMQLLTPKERQALKEEADETFLKLCLSGVSSDIHAFT